MQILEYIIDNTFVEFNGRIFQQTIGIPIKTNSVSLLAIIVSVLEFTYLLHYKTVESGISKN